MLHKKLMIVLLALLTASIYSCNEESDLPIPDLNPETEEGGEITIYDIGEVVPFSSVQHYSDPQFDVFDADIDIGGEGNVDLRLDGYYNPGPFVWPFTYLIMRFNAEIIHAPDAQPDFPDNTTPDTYPVFLPVDALTGSSVNGIWSPPNVDLHLLTEQNNTSAGEDPDQAWEISFKFPTGVSYIPTRSKVGNDYFYGWIEIFSSDYTDGDTDDFLLISRFGISNTAGLRVRMGSQN